MYVTDIDQKKRQQLELLRKSQQDPMTGVYNKAATIAKIGQALKTSSGRQTGVFMMIDIDHFKEINDQYGHPYGDKVLIKAADILRKQFRHNDIVGRLGGDEFCVFFSGVTSIHRIENAANTICKSFIENFPLKKESSSISCSIGISICAGMMKSFEQIYSEADHALYQVKQQGRNGYAFYDYSKEMEKKNETDH